MSEPHVLVVGGGLAGTTAALALRAAGCAVTLSSGAPGASQQFSGAWHFALSPGELALGQAEVAHHVAAVAHHEPAHPFGRLGAKAACAGLVAGWSLLQPKALHAGAGAADAVGSMSLVPHNTGALLPGVAEPGLAAVSLQGQATGRNVAADGEPSQAAERLTTAVIDLAAWGAPLSARALVGWQHDAAAAGAVLPALRWVRVPAPAGLPAHATASALALMRWLEEPAHLALLASSVQAVLAPGDRAVWCPAVLGCERAAANRAELAKSWQREVLEVAGAGGQWAPAWRRAAALQEQMRAAGVRRVGAAAKLRAATGGVLAVLADGQEMTARAVVLATGRFLGGGWQWPSQQRARERLLQLPLLAGGMPAKARAALDVTAAYPQLAHAVSALGLNTSFALQPIGGNASDPQVLARTFCAGNNLGGWQERLQPSSDGVAIVSGYWAAQGAAAAAKATPCG